MDLPRKIFQQANKKNIRYCVVRNFKAKEISTTPDLDILIDKSGYSSFRKILIDLGFIQIFSAPIPSHAVFIINNPENNSFLNVDLHVGGLIRDGLLYLPAERVLNDRLNYKEYFIPSLEDYVFGLTLHSIIDKRKVKKEYIMEIERATISPHFSWEYFLKKANRVLPYNSPKVYEHLKSKNYNKLVNLRERIILERYCLYPLGIFNTILIYLKRIGKVLNPFWKGKLVVFIGPEGSGKSYHSEKFRDRLLSAALRSKKVYMGWHELILPFHKLLLRTDRKIFTSKKKGGNDVSQNTFRSIIIFIIYFIELYARYLFRIFPARKIGIIVVTDRYFYDAIILYDEVPSFLKKIALRLIPKPSLCFYLTTASKNLSIRKNEVPYKILKKQHDLFELYKDEFKCEKVYSNSCMIKDNIVKIDSLFINS